MRSLFAAASIMVSTAAIADSPVSVEPLASGFDRVTGIHHVAAAGDQLYIVEQGGRIRLLFEGHPRATPILFLDIHERVLSDAFEQGLTGLAFAPDFPSDPRLFVHYIRGDGASIVSRFLLAAGDPLVGDPGSELVMLVVEQPHPTHNCNQLAFGPDGMLYVGCGDGGSGNGPILDPQWLGHLLGKVLRLDVSDLDPGETYRIPPDNPHVGVPGARGEIWANGLRNPYRFSFDVDTGDLWLADVGQATWEEIDRVPAGTGGVNFGWPVLEGAHCWPANTICDPQGFWLPVHEYAHSAGRCSVIGGLRVRDALQPVLAGIYLFADFCTGEIFGLREVGGEQFLPSLLGRALAHSPTTFGRAVDGSVLIGTYGGSILRVVVNDPIFTDDFDPP
jgi:hypothetical protein